MADKTDTTDKTDKTDKKITERELNKQRIIDIEERNGHIRIKKVLQQVPVGEDTWREGAISGRFPKGFKGGTPAHLWKQSDIDMLMDYSRINGNFWRDTSIKWEAIKSIMTAFRITDPSE